jgi:hypothetical protein
MKYPRKFHSFLKVKKETLQSWHSYSSLIFHQSLHKELIHYYSIKFVSTGYKEEAVPML